MQGSHAWVDRKSKQFTRHLSFGHRAHIRNSLWYNLDPGDPETITYALLEQAIYALPRPLGFSYVAPQVPKELYTGLDRHLHRFELLEPFSRTLQVSPQPAHALRTHHLAARLEAVWSDD